MKLITAVIALISTSEAIKVQKRARYTYEDIRNNELKCVADRNREWKYDAATNTWACPLKYYSDFNGGKPYFNELSWNE